MKKYILFIVLFTLGFIESKAQCPPANADLENWSSSSSANGWYSFNNASSVSQSSTAESGALAASINLAGGATRVYCDFLQPISCTQKPTSFNGYYKFTTTNLNDSLLFFAAVTPGFITSIQDTAVTEATNTQISMITDLNKEELNFSNIQGKATLEIYNISGMKISEKMLTESDAILNISTLRSGLYLAKVSMNDTQTTLKFFK